MLYVRLQGFANVSTTYRILSDQKASRTYQVGLYDDAVVLATDLC